jgi:hypothetical protein
MSTLASRLSVRCARIRITRRVLTCGAAAILVRVAPAQQQTIPIVELPAASAKTANTLGAVLGVRQSAGGKVLVNDALRRQMLLFDTTLAKFTVVMDSLPGTSSSYGARPTALIPFRGDSSLFADWNSRTVIVLDGAGRTARTLALPRPQDMIALNGALSGFDAKGRLVFQGGRPAIPPSGPGLPSVAMEMVDSLPILRADLDARRVDTIARIARPVMKVTSQKASDGAITIVYALDPLQAEDDWAVLSNGAVALIRGHDYHVDWIDADGTMKSAAKIPIDWKRLTDDDKQKLSDSLRVAQDKLLAAGYPAAEMTFRGPMPCSPPDGGRGAPVDAGGGVRTGRGGGSGGAPPPADAMCTERLRSMLPPVGEPTLIRAPMPPLADLYRAGPISDYTQPVRVGATMADLDGNLWILPRVSSLSKNGELVYDVVNSSGELFERVRLPRGRALAGFGTGGVVYLTSGNIKTGFYLERSTLPAPTSAKK